MSVLVRAIFPADQEVFRKSLAERANEYASLAAQARGRGAVHHRMSLLGATHVVVDDEWESAEKFQQFFADPEVQKFIGAAGATGEPDITISEAIDSPDRF